ncbi:MAG: DUF2183 domain-containing protein [Deltaproteobacteria bacterium]|nr:DUF2183 domain-containing protein [Deltaproteobacteria bacterium]
MRSDRRPLALVTPLFSLAIVAALAAGCAASDAGEDDSPLVGEAASSEGVTWLVSDIDDTIKRTGVRSSRVVVNALGTTNEFAGMSELYRAWRHAPDRARDITYLSAAPGPLIHFGRSFLSGAGFPGNASGVEEAVVGGRSASESAGDFKARKLVELYAAAAVKPRTVVLVGDNGEQDMAAYAAFMDHVQRTHARTKVYSFIHHVYETPGKGTPIESPHVPFVSAADLAVRFHAERWIDEPALARILGEVAHDSGTGGLASHVVPSFMECQGFRAWPTLAGAGPEAIASYVTVKTNIGHLCRP